MGCYKVLDLPRYERDGCCPIKCQAQGVKKTAGMACMLAQGRA